MSLPEYAPLSPVAQVRRASQLARVAHAGQVNAKNGEAYISHPARVAAHAVRLCAEQGLSGRQTARVVAAAWLHDVVEDTPVTAGMLRLLGFDDRVVDIVVLLTRSKEVASEDYYAAIAADPLAVLTKAADLADNTDPVRLAGLDAFTQYRLCRKYAAAFTALGVAVPDHVAQMLAA